MRYILKDGKISGSMICRDLRLEEKQKCVSTSMIQEQKFLMPIDVAYNIYCQLSNKMNNIKNDLAMQDLVNPLPFGKKEQQQQPYIK